MRILILTSSTGGGHNMRAQAFKAWAQTDDARKFNFEVSIHSALELTHPLYAFGVSLYNFIQKRSPRLHHLYFNYLELASMHRSKGRLLGKNKYRKLIKSYQPQIIISTHGHLNHGFFKMAQEGIKSPLACVTYCGELYGGYGFSKHWVNSECDLFIGAVPETCEAATQWGMPKDKNWCGGFLLKPEFYNHPTKEEYNKNFKLILSTGANSAHNHLSFLKALKRAALKPEVTALCGYNKKSHRKIISWANQFSDWQITPLGYHENMNQLLQGASAILARPGTGTTSEAIVTGCPIIHNTMGGVMPQEYITLKYCQKHGFARTINRARQLPDMLKDWMNNPRTREDEKAKMEAVRPRQHPIDILEKIHHLIP